MPIPVTTVSLPTAPLTDPDLELEVRIEELEVVIRSLIGELNRYAFIPRQYSEQMAGTLDDIADGVLYARVKDAHVGAGGSITISSTEVSDVSANADNTTTILSSTVIDAGRINLQTSTFLSTLPVGKTEAKCTDANADQTSANAQPSSWLTTNVAAGSIDITIGGSGVALDDMIVDQTNWDNGNASGLYMTTQYIGFWNTTTNVWDVRIKNDGTFYFKGDGDNYIQWDGSDITVAAEKGKLGSATNYFDITNSELKIAGGAANQVVINSSGIAVGYSATYATLVDSDGITAEGLLIKRGANTGLIAYVSAGNEANIQMTSIDSAAFITITENTATYTISGFKLSRCIVDSVSRTTQGALRISGNNLECYLNGAWVAAAAG